MRTLYKAPLLVAFSCMCMVGATGTAKAAEEADNPAQRTVTSPVMVTATRTEQDLKEVPISVTVVGEQELRRNPQLDVASQIAEVPGVQVFGQTAAGQRRVMIRGMSGARTLILIDGVRQPELRGIDGSVFNVEPSNIERIEVIKGPASVLYGSDAIGGVVNIITKKGTADKPFSLKVGMTYDSSVGSVEPRVSASGEYKGFNYYLSGTGVNANDRQTPKGKVWNSNYEQQQFSGRLGYKWDGGNVLFSADQRSGTHHTIPTKTDAQSGLLVPTDPYETATVTSLSESDNDRTGYSLTAELNDLSANFKRVKVHGYYQQLLNVSKSLPTFNNATYYPTRQKLSKTDKEQDSYGGSLQTDWSFGRHYVIAGLDYDKAQFDSKGYNYAATGGLSRAVDKRDGFQQTTAVFLQDEWELIDKLTLTLGLRQTWVETELTGYSNDPAMENCVKDDNLVGSAALVYTGIDNYSFRALFSQGYRNPNLLMLFMGSGTTMLANPDLKPEKSNNYELGVRYNNGAFNTDLALFLSDLKDGMSMVNVGVNEYQYINFNKVRNMGAELSADYTFSDLNLTPYGSLTWLRYESRDNGWSNTKNGRPSFWGKAGLKWETDLNENNRFFTDSNVVMTTGAYTDSRNATTGVITRSNERPGWATVNLSMGFEGAFLNSETVKYNTVLQLRNLFDKYHTPIMSSPMPEAGFNVVWSFGLEY